MMLSVRTAITLLLVFVAFISMPLADLEITTIDPWGEMGRMVAGFLSPEVESYSTVVQALLATLVFALLGVALGACSGFLLAMRYQLRSVRWFCAAIRSVHELFWALIFLQFLGLHPLSGVLAIAIPYAGIFARIYSELLAQAPNDPERVIHPGGSGLSRLIYGRVAAVWPNLRSYTSYRLECGIRSSAVLGFVGLPTLGYYLESAFSQGYYGEVAALLLLFYGLIISKRVWLRAPVIVLLLLATPWLMDARVVLSLDNMVRFFSVDIVPAPLLNTDVILSLATLTELSHWMTEIITQQALPGIWNMLLLSQLALVLTGILALLWFPLISRHFVSKTISVPGQVWLVIARSTPEYLLAYMLLQLFGPSMLPAVLALAIHNGGLIGYLTARQADQLNLRPDYPARYLDRYCYEVLPRCYNGFLSFLLYRWEVIMRETAILGILGIQSIGFFIDSAIQEIRFDVAIVLIGIAAMVNILVDSISYRLQARIRTESPVA